MNRIFALAAAAAVSLAAAPASAAIVWRVEGVFAAAMVPSLVASRSAAAGNGGELSGTFTTEEDASGMRVIAVDLTTTAYKGYQAHTYDVVDEMTVQWLPQFFRLYVPVSETDGYELQLFFGGPQLDEGPGPSFAFSGYEHQPFVGAGNRMLTGTATYDYSYDASVPEPGSWALMIAGFGLAGTALRRRNAPSRA